MNIRTLLNIIDVHFYVGVPDSQLKPLCSYLINEYGISDKHIIAANEGNAVGLAAGYYLATGKTPVVYLQNSGIGNIVNPVVSLLNDKVYGIPCIFIIGWRGEPGVHDEPQHVFQGEITLKLLADLDISSFVIDKQTTKDEKRDIRHLYRSPACFRRLRDRRASDAFGTAARNAGAERARLGRGARKVPELRQRHARPNGGPDPQRRSGYPFGNPLRGRSPGPYRRL